MRSGASRFYQCYIGEAQVAAKIACSYTPASREYWPLWHIALMPMPKTSHWASASTGIRRCQFCHGPDGDGHGDPRSPGKAPNLHQTALNREQLIEVVACGRPATEMPHFDKYAYEDKDCYGLSAVELGKDIPPDPHSTPLTKREIEA